MRPTKARHLSADPVTNPPVIARHRKTFKEYVPPTVTFHKAGTNPKNAEELGHKGRGMAGR